MTSIRKIIPDISELGYVRVAGAVTTVSIGDAIKNLAEHVRLAKLAEEQGVDIVCFPELGLSSYSIKDYFLNEGLFKDVRQALKDFCEQTKDLRPFFIVGLPWRDVSDRLLNVAAIIKDGQVLALIPKSYLPNYSEFEEERWFLAALGLSFRNINFCGQSVPVGTDILIDSAELDCSFGAEICEDGWMPIPPSCLGTANGAHLYFNLSASPEKVGSDIYRRNYVVNPQAARCVSGYIYVSAGQSESTTGVVFGGHTLISENGSLIAEKPPLSGDGDLLVTDIDVGKLRSERRRSNTWGHSSKYWSGLFPYRHISY